MVNPQYINKNTFQIISAGIDGLFGPGGGYKADAANPLADYVGLWSYSASPPGPVPSQSMRLREKDNVTNFKGGRLD
jgi:general secretion pathway protein G